MVRAHAILDAFVAFAAILTLEQLFSLPDFETVEALSCIKQAHDVGDKHLLVKAISLLVDACRAKSIIDVDGMSLIRYVLLNSADTFAESDIGSFRQMYPPSA